MQDGDGSITFSQCGFEFDDLSVLGCLPIAAST